VTIDPIAQSPVLLVAPDTLVITHPAGDTGTGSLAVHNRGNSLLNWAVRDTMPSTSVDQCPLPKYKSGCLRFATGTGLLPEGTSASLSITSLVVFPRPIPITFTSAAGDVQVVIVSRSAAVPAPSR
jgi:hypothetical protein